MFNFFALKFEPMEFIFNLKYMIIGMISIFVVIGVIIIITVLLNKIFTKKK